ncbi:MAG: SRPBCC family protein [Solirubrobacteraceae bacterium]
MGRQHIDIRTTTEAEPDAVWRLLGDSYTWPSWSPIEWVILDRHGDADGLGEVRTFKQGKARIREQIVERQPERGLSYKLVSGLPLRSYHVDVDLTPQSPGTEIRWHTTFRSAIPGLGWLYRRALTKTMRQFVDGLARHARHAED